MLVHLLDAIVEAGRTTGWGSDPSRAEPIEKARDRVALAEYWQQSRLLIQIERDALTQRDVMRVRSRRAKLRFTPVIEAYDRYEALIGNLDRRAVRESVEQVALITASEGTLFELLNLFAVIDALNEIGWNLSPIRLFHGKLEVTGRRADGRRLQLLYQSTPAELNTHSTYRETLSAHGLSQTHPLRPDVTLHWESPRGTSRWLLVECKLSEGLGGGHAARQALLDLLAYRWAFKGQLHGLPEPYGLGVAWGAELPPNVTSGVMLCTPDHVADALRAVVT